MRSSPVTSQGTDTFLMILFIAMTLIALFSCCAADPSIVTKLG